MERYVVGITGASGVIYGKRLVELLLEKGSTFGSRCEVFLMVTDPAREVFRQELGIDDVASCFSGFKNLHYLDYHNLTASIASGSFKIKAMIVIPCSMSTLSAIACGNSNNLLERAADVAIKERRQLVLVPRETPLSEIHLKNMLVLRGMGVDIVPAMPPFYANPGTIDELVDAMIGKVLSALGIDTGYEWQG
ncbi:UbiX family flavin prenyltransferase [Candidatus Desantisbacteria bacterium]|nr:UbiX family flavin prenyltransferase [Candidatus Desantisbacteria bacterium]